MKRIGIFLIKFILNLIYLVFKLRKSKEKIVMLSRQSNEISIDFRLLKENFEKRGVEVVILCKKLEPGVKNLLLYSLHIIQAMYHLGNSRYCIIDGYSIPVSLLVHKKQLRVLQLWHALGAIKKFGYQILDMQEGSKRETAEILNMHRKYTYVTCASEETKKIFTKSFDIPTKKIKIAGMPRVDYLKNLKDNYNKNIYTDYPHLKEKKNILYVPTFRKKKSVKYQELIDVIDKDKYNLIVRLHPLDKNKVSDKYALDKKYSTYDLLQIADYIITDYSAVAIEASILNKPVYFYLYDIKKYKEGRGLNIDVTEKMKSSTSRDPKVISEKIKSGKYNFRELKKFRESYIETLDFDNTDAIVNLIMNGEPDEDSKKN